MNLLDICQSILKETKSSNIPISIIGNSEDSATQIFEAIKISTIELVRNYHCFNPALDSFVDKKGSLRCCVIMFTCLNQGSSSNYYPVDLTKGSGFIIWLIMCCASFET